MPFQILCCCKAKGLQVTASELYESTDKGRAEREKGKKSNIHV